MTVLPKILVTLALAGCAPSSPSPEPAPAPATPAPTTTPERTTPPRTEAPAARPAPSAARATLRYRDGRTDYDYAATASVVMEGDTARAPEDVRTSARVTIALVPAGTHLEIAGRVDSFTVQVGRRIAGAIATMPQQPLSVSFTGTIGADGHPTLREPANVACGSQPAAALGVVREILVPLPGEITAGTQWSDSTTTTTCRGGVTITAATRTDYTAEGQEDRAGVAAWRIARRTTVVLSGEGRQAKTPVVVTGQGGGTGAMWVDAERGRVLGIQASQTVQLAFSAGELQQRFVQRTTLVVASR